MSVAAGLAWPFIFAYVEMGIASVICVFALVYHFAQPDLRKREYVHQVAKLEEQGVADDAEIASLAGDLEEYDKLHGIDTGLGSPDKHRSRHSMHSHGAGGVQARGHSSPGRPRGEPQRAPSRSSLRGESSRREGSAKAVRWREGAPEWSPSRRGEQLEGGRRSSTQSTQSASRWVLADSVRNARDRRRPQTASAAAGGPAGATPERMLLRVAVPTDQ